MKVSDAGGRVVFVQPGYSLYIPGGWYHQVSNLEESMCLFILFKFIFILNLFVCSNIYFRYYFSEQCVCNPS